MTKPKIILQGMIEKELRAEIADKDAKIADKNAEIAALKAQLQKLTSASKD